MNRLRIPLLLLASLLLVTSCRSHHPVAADNPDATPGSPTAHSQYTLITFSATVDGISVNGQVRWAKDSLIWGSASKMLEVGRALATPDSVWVRSALLGIREAGTYADVQRRIHHHITFAQLQDILASDDIEQRLAELSQRVGHPATVRILRREQVDRLSFPFNK